MQKSYYYLLGLFLLISLVALLSATLQVPIGGSVADTCTNCLYLSYREFIDPDVILDFEEEYQIDVQMVEFNPDVVIGEDAVFGEEISTDQEIIPSLYKNNRSIPYLWYTVGIGYNEDFFVEEPDWNVFWEPPYQKRAQLADDSTIVPILLERLNLPYNSTEPKHLAAAEEQLREIGLAKDATIVTGLISRKLVAGHVTNREAYTAMLTNPSVRYVPYYVRVLYMGVAPNAQNPDAAKKLIAFLSQEKVSKQNALYSRLASPIVGVGNDTLFYPDAAKLPLIRKNIVLSPERIGGLITSDTFK